MADERRVSDRLPALETARQEGEHGGRARTKAAEKPGRPTCQEWRLDHTGKVQWLCGWVSLAVLACFPLGLLGHTL